MRMYGKPLCFTGVLSFLFFRGYQPELDQTLPHVRQGTRFENGRPNLGIVFPESWGTKQPTSANFTTTQGRGHVMDWGGHF